MLGGRLDETGFREGWKSHLAKLERIQALVFLSAPTIERVLTAVDDDFATRLRGLYVDVGQDDPTGAPQTPCDVGAASAEGVVETAEEAVRLFQQHQATLWP